jgi:hypothetical protein
MSKTKRFYKTEITFTVLSEIPVENIDLASLVLECNAGDMVGKESERKVQELSASFMRDELVEAGSEPGFFSLDLGTTDHVRVSWLEDLSRGDRVKWNDPDQGTCSGRGCITSIESDSASVENTETIICLRMDDGGEVEVTCAEIEPIQDAHEAFLQDLWRRDQVKVGDLQCVIIDPIITSGDPRSWVWSVAPIDQNGDIIGPAFEANGGELS